MYVHLVWATWDRQLLLVDDVERVARRAIGAKCGELGAETIALGGMEDHVHLLVKLPVTLAVATLVGQVKGASAHAITHETLAAEGFFKWQGAYGAVSVSPQHLKQVAAYIHDQRERHSAGSRSPLWNCRRCPIRW